MTTATIGLANFMQVDSPTVDGMNSEQLKDALSAHREMNIPTDQTWAALVDSIRHELVHLPDLSGVS